ncbi:hypothetical protein [Pelagibacterium sp.]|uniref:hypothetical protein n=1 Tax=Pelagibacterium sp. TaxID=1967288 RepID=UPI003A8D3A4E
MNFDGNIYDSTARELSVGVDQSFHQFLALDDVVSLASDGIDRLRARQKKLIIHRDARQKSYRIISSFGTKQREFFITDSDADKGLHRLRSFKTRRNGWDGENGLAPTTEVLNSAIDAFALLQNSRLRLAVNLGSDGVPLFNLRDSSWSGEIAIVSPNELNFEFERGDELLEGYRLGFTAKSLPTELREAIAVMRR